MGVWFDEFYGEEEFAQYGEGSFEVSVFSDDGNVTASYEVFFDKNGFTGANYIYCDDEEDPYFADEESIEQEIELETEDFIKELLARLLKE